MPPNCRPTYQAAGCENLTEDVKKPYREMCEIFANSIGVAIRDLENIVVADKDNYGPEIERLGGAPYTTEATGGVSFARTISRFDTNNHVKCSIVLPWQTFEQIIIAFPKTAEKRSVKEQLFYLRFLLRAWSLC
jgi:hypothetical protein